MQTTLHIKDLEFSCILGVLSFEREKPQRVLVECEVVYEFLGEKPALASGAVESKRGSTDLICESTKCESDSSSRSFFRKIHSTKIYSKISDFDSTNYLDYTALADLLKATMIAEKFLLIEEALEELHSRLYERFKAFSLASVDLSLTKLDILPYKVRVSSKKHYK